MITWYSLPFQKKRRKDFEDMTTLQDTVKDNHSREELMKLWEEHDNFFGKGIPPGVQEILNNAFSKVPVSSFPDLPSGEGNVPLGCL